MSLSNVIKTNSTPVEQGGKVAKGQPNAPAENSFLSFADLWKETADSSKSGIVEDPFKAREDLRLARRRSDIIIEEAGQEAERLKKEGFEQGLEEGRKQAAEETAQLMKEYADILAQIQEQRTALQQSYEGDVMTMVKAMVERLANHEVTVNPKVIQAVLRRAMEFVVEQSEVRVRLHPEDFQRIRAAGLEDPSLLEGKSQVHLIEDPTVSMGGCFLESTFGEIDATLETCRVRLFAAIDGAFQAAQAAESANGGNQ
jgi:flagellar assembly protein FliH